MFAQRSPLGRLPALATAAVAAVAIGTLAACTETGSPGPTEIATAESGPAPVYTRSPEAQTQRGLATLRRATARYHRVEAAEADGFARQPFGCVDPVPDEPGVIGIPFGNFDRVDTNIDLSEPEVLLYEPQKNGTLRLVGIELLVPKPAWDADHDEPPSVLGQEFHESPAGLPVYGIHLWVWRHNPEGMFALENPRISCEFAG